MTPYPRHVPASVLSCGVRKRGFLRDIEHTSTLPDWPAPDEPAALFPSAGVGAVGLALEGRVDPRCEPMEGAVRNETQLGRFRPQASLGWEGDWEVAPMPCCGAGGARMVAWVAGWWLGWTFVRVQTREGRSRATSKERRSWGDFGPRPPWDGWMAGGGPEAVSWC